MGLENKWLFFHCIKRDLNLKSFYSTEYECHQVDNIINIKLPKIGSQEYLIPICSYTPRKWINYYLERHIRNLIKVEIIP